LTAEQGSCEVREPLAHALEASGTHVGQELSSATGGFEVG